MYSYTDDHFLFRTFPTRMCVSTARLLAVAVALLQLSAGVHGSTPLPSSFNFSAATAAAAFSVGNLTFIGCEGYDDAGEADRACTTLLGHTRGKCTPFPAHRNATWVAICRCITYAGLTPPGNCVDVTCVWGTDSCSVRQWQNYFAFVLHIFAVLLTAYIFGFGIYVIAAGRKNMKMNSMAVTLVSMTLNALFHLLWRASAFLGFAVLLSTVPIVDVQKPFLIPAFSLFGLVGVLAFPLQWLEVAKKTAQIKATRGDSRKGPHIAVAIAAFVITAAIFFFAITGQTFLITGEFLRHRSP